MNPTQPAFFADAMLGRLANHLIHAGFDCRYVPGISDQRLIETAVEQDRIILTRDRGLLGKRSERGKKKRIFVFSVNSLKKSLQYLGGAYKLTFRRSKIFTRCADCNRQLKPTPKSTVENRIPPETSNWIDDYFICPGCDKVYWKGSHYEALVKKLKSWGLLDQRSMD